MRCIVMLVFALATASPANATPPFRQGSIVLLQPVHLLERRVAVQELSSYIKRLNDTAARQATNLSDQTPRAGFFVFAIRPDGSRKIWLDLKPALSSYDANVIISSLEAAPPCAVREGTVIAAISVSLWGGKTEATNMPMPEEWRASITEGSVEVTQLVDSLWPRSSAPGHSDKQTIGTGAAAESSGTRADTRAP